MNVLYLVDQKTNGLEGTSIEKLESFQLCPVCNRQIGVLAGSLDAICKNCGFKDPCCE